MKKIVYVDMDNVLVDFQSAFPKLSKKVLNEYENNKDNIPGIFALMEPMPSAIESFIELTRHFETYVLSTAPWNNSSAWKELISGLSPLSQLWVNFGKYSQTLYKKLHNAMSKKYGLINSSGSRNTWVNML